jgi:hypothetical protein
MWSWVAFRSIKRPNGVAPGRPAAGVVDGAVLVTVPADGLVVPSVGVAVTVGVVGSGSTDLRPPRPADREGAMVSPSSACQRRKPIARRASSYAWVNSVNACWRKSAAAVTPAGDCSFKPTAVTSCCALSAARSSFCAVTPSFPQAPVSVR